MLLPAQAATVFVSSLSSLSSKKMSQDIADQNIQIWKMKKLSKSLDSAHGYVHIIIAVDLVRDLKRFSIDDRAGTSMISLIIPPKVC